MAKQQPFVDPDTGLKRQRAQRPDGAGTRYRIGNFKGWEIYYCLAEDCQFDTQWSEAFDFHYYHKHELPCVQKQAFEEAAARARERAERQKERREIPILKRY